MFKSLKNYERFRRVVSLVAPNRCPFCGEVLDNSDYWCGECIRHLPFIHGIVPPPENISELFVCCSYSGRARGAVLMLKYGGLVYPADAFAKMMSEKLRNAEADMLVPVPNGKEGVQKRGFSSSELISERLSMRVGIPTMNALSAVSGKREQKSLSASARRRNALHSFFVNGRVKVRGKRIILIDEVTTTGSTLSAAGELLLKAGAKDVSAAVFAKTVEFTHGRGKYGAKG
ncbi:MAG: ComF family protein [Ruminococcaceae bacterium]|nr:ComF family protein [Oscillospiraceae bacterium]